MLIKKTLPILLLLLLIFLPKAFSQGEPLQLRAAIHLSSTASEGSYDLPNIAALAKDNGISVVMITDRDLMKWEYGLWPLRSIIKKTVKHKSVFTYGIKRYLNYIEQIQEKFPELVLIPEVESAPFYYWQGSPVESADLQEKGAAGNNNTRMGLARNFAQAGAISLTEVAYPAKYSEVIAVGALNQYGKIYNQSAQSEEVDLYFRGYRGRSAGTSIASAYAAGTMARVISENPKASLEELKNIILITLRSNPLPKKKDTRQ